MRYVAAALLSAMSGSDPSKASIKSILDSVGIECENEKVDLVLKSLAGKSIEEIIEEGKKKLASVPSGGAAPAAAGGAADPAGAPAAAKAEAKKEEPEEESDDDMGFGLFD
ncbi:RP-LP2 [Lepeophtheirus salmonis]|uniref:Large ribosomal subunit protein P2 n=2 Tax=Lepeophtheirus salmonis TaxID=72036 RepID=A0A7R8CNI5_LEPSM|nr:RP-LP2 [Lepeophtheirus salmonis]CAF2830076.1 RP-LP2 [Lepeophtheirus salmonis]